MSLTDGQGPVPSNPPTDDADDGPDVLLPLITEATQGEYAIERELGRGGMAAVYLATDIALNRKVAIKTMLPELIAKTKMVQRFKREAQMAAGLSHPHIIQIHTVRETKRLVYFVMKFIEGRSLDSIISERGALDLDTARLILQQAGSALSFAHHRGVIHRDVKPANIMIDENGWAVMTDFGIAKLEEAQNLTATGTTIGTPQYMSPEQFHAKPITGASDQYALGIVAYEMLTGKKPFDGGTLGEIVTQHLFKEPPDIRADRPDLPPTVADAIVRMLAKDPAGRFPDLDTAIAAFGPPANLDMVRAQLMSFARTGAAKKPRLSVPMSPVPVTRPSAQATAVLSSTPTPVVAPSAIETPRATSGKRPRTMLWIGAAAAVVLLAVGGYFGYTRLAGGDGASLDRGVALWQQGRAADAQTEFLKAARELPASAMPHVYLSRMARESGRLPIARVEAARAVKLEPDNALALREMGLVLLASGENEMARRFFIRALRVNPADRMAMGWLGCSLQRMGQPAPAARWLERAGPGAWSACVSPRPAP